MHCLNLQQTSVGSEEKEKKRKRKTILRFQAKFQKQNSEDPILILSCACSVARSCPTLCDPMD